MPTEHETPPLSTLTNTLPRSADEPIVPKPPRNAEPPERRKLIDEARARIEAGEPYDPPRQWRHLFPAYVLKIQEWRAEIHRNAQQRS